MAQDLKPGARGWIAYLGEYVVEAEFVGYHADLEPDYPREPAAFYRLLEDVDTKSAHCYKDGIVVEEQFASDPSVLHETRDGAVRKALAYVEYWLQRKRDGDSERAAKAEALRVELAALTSGGPT